MHKKIEELLTGTGKVDQSLVHRSRAGEVADLRQQLSLAERYADADASDPDLRLKWADLMDKSGKTELAHGWYPAAIGMSSRDEPIQERWKPVRLAIHERPLKQFCPQKRAEQNCRGH